MSGTETGVNVSAWERIMEKSCAVYYLIDPETKEIRYVGISVNPRQRYRAHLTTREKSRCACWIKSLRGRCAVPHMRIIAWVQDEEEAKRIEVGLIARLSNLTNLTDGGDGGVLPEACAKMSVSHHGVKLSESHRAAQSAGQRKRYENLEARMKMKVAADRAWSNPESRVRASAASTGRRMPAEACERIRATLMGHKVTEEARAKMSVGHKGKTHSVETRAKMSASHKGHITTEETRQKISFVKRQRAIERIEQEIEILRSQL
jgi:hypothetical protein